MKWKFFFDELDASEEEGSWETRMPSHSPMICPNCGHDDGHFIVDQEVTCKACGCVQGSIIESKPRRAYTAEQVKARKTTSNTSFLLFDKNLGSVIGASMKHRNDQRIRRLVLTERRRTIEANERELKEVIRMISLLADSNKLCLTRNEVENLIITYRQKFLGKKISIGRPRMAVILAFVFLELRESKNRSYLSLSEFLDKVNVDKGCDCEGSSTADMGDIIYDDFLSAVSNLVKEYGYNLHQPSLKDQLYHVMTGIHVSPSMIKDALHLASIIRPYFRGKGVKVPGIVGAIIKIILEKNGIPSSKKSMLSMVPGVESYVTIKNRIEDIKKFLKMRFFANRSWINKATIMFEGTDANVKNVEIPDHGIQSIRLACEPIEENYFIRQFAG